MLEFFNELIKAEDVFKKHYKCVNCGFVNNGKNCAVIFHLNLEKINLATIWL